MKSVKVLGMRSSAEPPRDRTRIVIVDDDRFFAEMLQAALAEKDELDVVGLAADGAQAVVLAERLRPDLVLIDRNMPGVDGVEAAHRLRELDAPPAVVFVTGSAPDEARATPPAGALASLEKAEDLAMLIESIGLLAALVGGAHSAHH